MSRCQETTSPLRTMFAGGARCVLPEGHPGRHRFTDPAPAPSPAPTRDWAEFTATRQCRCGAYALLTATGVRYEENAGAICRHRSEACEWFAPRAPAPPSEARAIVTTPEPGMPPRELQGAFAPRPEPDRPCPHIPSDVTAPVWCWPCIRPLLEALEAIATHNSKTCGHHTVGECFRWYGDTARALLSARSRRGGA